MIKTLAAGSMQCTKYLSPGNLQWIRDRSLYFFHIVLVVHVQAKNERLSSNRKYLGRIYYLNCGQNQNFSINCLHNRIWDRSLEFLKFHTSIRHDVIIRTTIVKFQFSRSQNLASDIFNFDTRLLRSLLLLLHKRRNKEKLMWWIKNVGEILRLIRRHNFRSASRIKMFLLLYLILFSVSVDRSGGLWWKLQSSCNAIKIVRQIMRHHWWKTTIDGPWELINFKLEATLYNFRVQICENQFVTV